MPHDATLLILDSWLYSQSPRPFFNCLLTRLQRPGHAPLCGNRKKWWVLRFASLGKHDVALKLQMSSYSKKKKKLWIPYIASYTPQLPSVQILRHTCTLHVETASLCINPFLKISNSMRTNQHDANMYYMILYACLLGILINVGNVGNSLMFY